MKIELNFKLKINPGDFGCIIADNKLFIPTKLNDFCVQNDIRSVEELLSFMLSFSGSMLNFLKWNHEEFNIALNKLQTLLVGKVNERFLGKHNPMKVYTGIVGPMRMK
jgi:hypothetical protein